MTVKGYRKYDTEDTGSRIEDMEYRVYIQEAGF